MVNHSSSSPERGRGELRVWTLACTLAAFFLLVQAWVVTVHFPGWGYPGPFLLVLVLSVLTYRGRRWARALLAVLCGLLAIGVSLSALQGFAYATPATAIVALVVAGTFAASSWRIATSAHISAYFQVRSGTGNATINRRT